MGAVDLVQRCWNDLTTRGSCAAPAAATVLDEILRAYGEPHRHYHTLDHIAALLALLARHADAGADRDALELAVLFHDIVYDPSRQDNEEASASLAAGRLARLGFPQCAKVARYIRATRHDRSADAAGDADLALLLDLDLSILAAVPSEYHVYAQAVRREYAFVPDQLYRPGRRGVLQGFLARERVYLTDRLRAAWEERARTNIAAEIAELA